MTTTPEQLQAWRVKFESAYPSRDLGFIDSGEYRLRYIESQWQGYLRAKQETEQIMKLAKFGAIVLKNVYGLSESVDALADSCELLLDEETFKPEIEVAIKGLLK